MSQLLFGETLTPRKAPTELVDGDYNISAIRIDGPQDTREKAKAFFAQESGERYIDIRVRKAYFADDPADRLERIEDGQVEPYDGWPMMWAKKGTPGAAAYWECVFPEPSW